MKCEFLEKCMNLFVTQGIRSVSMEDIVRNTNTSKKVLYEEYGNKEGIIKSVVDYECETTCSEFKNVQTESENAIEEMLKIHRYFMNKFEQVNPVLFYDLTKYYYEIYLMHKHSKKDMTLSFIQKNIDRGIHENIYRKDLDKDIVSKLWLSKIQQLQAEDLFPLREYSIHYVCEQMTELHLRSIANENGLKIINKNFNKK